MGANRAVHLLGKEFAGADTLATARALALACKKIGYDLIFCGKFSTDAETAQVPPMLAEMLDLPQVTGATKLEFLGKKMQVTRELDDGFETIECGLPAVLSAAERLIKPGRATPEDLEKAKDRPIEV
jgi:electron transfer flavoprotein alpha/beta subunit